MSAQKGHFGENWVVKVETGLVRRTSVPKGLEVKIGAFRKNVSAQGATWIKQGFTKNQFA